MVCKGVQCGFLRKMTAENTCVRYCNRVYAMAKLECETKALVVCDIVRALTLFSVMNSILKNKRSGKNVLETDFE